MGVKKPDKCLNLRSATNGFSDGALSAPEKESPSRRKRIVSMAFRLETKVRLLEVADPRADSALVEQTKFQRRISYG
jgi:hypothetical protein